MARLHEYQGKAILAANGFKIPRGRVASTTDEAMATAKELGGEVVIKIQVWTTGRAGIGGVVYAKKPDEVRVHATRMLATEVGQFPVEAVLVEEKIDIDREFFLSFAIDDAARAPVIIFAAGGGTGIEERATSTRKIQCDVKSGPADAALNEAVGSCGLSSKHAKALAESIHKLFAAARGVEARSLEINPLVLTKDGEFVAADCRITIDDYAVVRHPELKIEIAREFDHPPTALERVAYAVEQNAHRGTFYFAQLATTAAKDSKGLVGFHGAGGGGWMLPRDAIVNAGFTIAHFTDTRGNPAAANEDRAVDILQRMSRLLGAAVEGYRKTDAPATIATRFAELIATGKGAKWKPRGSRMPKFTKDQSVTTIPVKGGRVWIDSARWPQICSAVETHSGGLIVDRAGASVPSVPGDEFATKDSELLACDVECRLAGVEGFYLELDIPELNELIGDKSAVRG